MTKQKTAWGKDTGLKYKWESENKPSEVKTYKWSKEELEKYLKKFKKSK